MDKIAERRRFALQAALEAGRLTLERFRANNLQVNIKGDGTPVTEADRAAEQLIRDRLAEAWPDDGVLGEEFDDRPTTSGVRWIIDPIDGTYSFARGLPLYATLLAAEVIGPDGEPDPAGPSIGVIHFPALDETIHAARGLGAVWIRGGREVPARVSDISDPRKACCTTTGIEYLKDPQARDAYFRLCEAFGNDRMWADAYGFAAVATGRCEAVYESSVAPWDIAPAVPIIEEAGGRFTDRSGRPGPHGGSAVATNGHLHEVVLRLVKH